MYTSTLLPTSVAQQRNQLNSAGSKTCSTPCSTPKHAEKRPSTQPSISSCYPWMTCRMLMLAGRTEGKSYEVAQKLVGCQMPSTESYVKECVKNTENKPTEANLDFPSIPRWLTEKEPRDNEWQQRDRNENSLVSKSKNS
jgi:hypothetical protein